LEGGGKNIKEIIDEKHLVDIYDNHQANYFEHKN
jgi:hypothetical protein